MGFLGKLAEESEGTFRLDVHDILGNDEHSVALVMTHVTRKGATLDNQVVQVTHVRDGQTAEFWSASTNPVASTEFWT